MRFLLFTLYAPIASFGEVAVGERRMGWTRPARSAVLGLLAAARGIDRADEAAHRDLEESLHYAVRTEASGSPFNDYHTAQVPSARRGRTFATRRNEVRADRLNTVLSTREWRTDAYFTAAVWPRPGHSPDLDGLSRALNMPHYTLYLGRRSAPLGLPLNPTVLDAPSFLEAFAMRAATDVEREVLERVGSDETPEIACDHDIEGLADVRVERRRDAIASRSRWQFNDRLEAVLVGGQRRE